jgi:hypothetical protein
MGLVLGTLDVEEQALASDGSPGSRSVGVGGLVASMEGRQMLGLDGIFAKVEVSLGEKQATERMLVPV